jgi:hypothetical protein
MPNITLEQLVSVAREAEVSNPIDWGELPINEELVYKTFALASYNAYQTTDPVDKDLVLLASIIKLQVENFALKQQQFIYMDTISNLQKG